MVDPTVGAVLRAMTLILWIALGGALGAVGRHLLTAAVNEVPTGPWKLGTLSANLLGCLFFGLIWAKADQKLQLQAPVAIALLSGFLGAFTTFSTYAFQTISLARDAHLGWAALNLITHNVLGLAMVLVGLALAGGLSPTE